MRDVGEPVSLLQCTEALRDVFPELKKPDGTRYKGSLERAIHGALWSTGVFRKNEHELWTLKDDDANDYERKLTSKFQERSKKRKNLSSAAKSTFSLMKKQRRKYTRKSGKRGDIVRLLATFSQGHKEAADRAAMADAGNVPPELQALFKNPFKVCFITVVLFCTIQLCCDWVYCLTGLELHGQRAEDSPQDWRREVPVPHANLPLL